MEVGPDQTLELRLLVIAPKGAMPANATDVVIFAKDMKAGVVARAKDHFFPR